MHSFKVLSAIVAVGAGMVSADNCKNIKITTNNQDLSQCQTVTGDVTVDSSLTGIVAIEGPRQIKGDLIIKNATGITQIQSTSLNSVGGTFQLDGLNFLSNLQMSSLRSINNLIMNKLGQLGSFTFGSTGVTKATSVTISDTFISDLSGLNLATVQDFTITQNSKLTSFNSDLVNVTGTLQITFNGNNFNINMSMLEMAQEVQVRGIKGFAAPSLGTITGSMYFDNSSSLASFSAPNLTSITGSLSFQNNKKLSNLEFPALTKIGGGFTILNNTALMDLEGFEKLKDVGGAILFGGSFEKVSLKSLSNVVGTVKVTSTTDIADFCKEFDDFSSSGVIQGEESCTSNNKKANSGGDGGDSGTSGGSSDGSSSGDGGDSSGAFNHVNMALLGLAGVAALAQLM